MGYNLRKIQCKGIVIKKWLGDNSREDTVTPQEYLVQIDSTYLPKLMSIVESVKIKRQIKELDKIFERIHQNGK